MGVAPMGHATFSLFQMFKLDLPRDPKEVATTEARRRREKERQHRVFDVRTRLIGVSGRRGLSWDQEPPHSCTWRGT